ncbi:hypothetical protein BAMTA208_13905 [Bacillus amyloliquefaciens TA208]|nr:hypothetical protein BAMTA208_13905 [Bacillus amyloliquefaciens TA208]
MIHTKKKNHKTLKKQTNEGSFLNKRAAIIKSAEEDK